jgi:outer membrane protein OmpA-like peptidoglycan-associated protein
MNTAFKMTAIAAGLGAALSGCSGMPEQIDTLEHARSTVQTIEQDTLASEAAGAELSEARSAIDRAEEMYEDKADIELVRHEAYVADRHARIAEQRIAEAHAKEELDNSKVQRQQVLLEAREREADQAQTLAAQRGQTVDRLQQQLDELQAEQTDRGAVLTLGDVLFETGEADLQPGAANTIDKLVSFMQDYPERRVLIEGYTDSRGSEAFNMQLSENRAESVEDALVDEGIDPGRIRVAGLGEAYPVASNNTSAGMQQNRRVEVVISDENGAFPERVQQRIASATSLRADAG